jgi:hypothetical protein
MATEKLAEGIRNFTADIVKLEKIVKEKMWMVDVAAAWMYPS